MYVFLLWFNFVMVSVLVVLLVLIYNYYWLLWIVDFLVYLVGEDGMSWEIREDLIIN